MSGIKLTDVSKSFGSFKVIHGVDIEIEQGEFSQSALHLQANPDAPNLLQLERRLLPNQLAFVPRSVMMKLCRFHRDLLSV